MDAGNGLSSAAKGLAIDLGVVGSGQVILAAVFFHSLLFNFLYTICSILTYL